MRSIKTGVSTSATSLGQLGKPWRRAISRWASASLAPVGSWGRSSFAWMRSCRTSARSGIWVLSDIRTSVALPVVRERAQWRSFGRPFLILRWTQSFPRTRGRSSTPGLSYHNPPNKPRPSVAAGLALRRLDILPLIANQAEGTRRASPAATLGLGLFGTFPFLPSLRLTRGQPSPPSDSPRLDPPGDAPLPLLHLPPAPGRVDEQGARPGDGDRHRGVARGVGGALAVGGAVAAEDERAERGGAGGGDGRGALGGAAAGGPRGGAADDPGEDRSDRLCAGASGAGLAGVQVRRAGGRDRDSRERGLRASDVRRAEPRPSAGRAGGGDADHRPRGQPGGDLGQGRDGDARMDARVGGDDVPARRGPGVGAAGRAGLHARRPEGDRDALPPARVRQARRRRADGGEGPGERGAAPLRPVGGVGPAQHGRRGRPLREGGAGTGDAGVAAAPPDQRGGGAPEGVRGRS